jgi:16S rRNA (cytidine1402-2'-O)-methyltransferase
MAGVNEQAKGRLTVVATPIGNLGDLSPRAKAALEEAEVLACEDTRMTKKLLQLSGISNAARALAYHEYNEQQAAPGIVKLVQEGKRVVLVSDAGLPGLSDPGYRVLHLCREAGIPVEVIPGAHAAPMALLMSGLPSSSYTFKGFVPKKPGARSRFFAEEAQSPHVLVAYESPLRLADTLGVALEALGERQASVALEMTKLHERCLHGTLSSLKAQLEAEPPQGEAVLVIAPLPRKERQAADQE